MPQVLLYMLQVLNAIPGLLAAGQSVMGLVNNATVAVQNMQAENRDPSPAEWDALNKTIAALRSELHAS